MAESPIDIDRIVREVIGQLGLAPGAGAPAAADPSTPPRSENDLVISCRVVTLAEVQGRLEAVRRLVVPPQAVITPAVRDELRRRNVSLAYASPVAPEASGKVRLVLVTVGERFDPTPLAGALNQEATQIQRHTFDCLIAATDLLGGELPQPDTLGLLLSRHTAAGLCLANRHRGVRAVTGTDAGAVSAAAAAVGANLLVIDPAEAGFFQLKHIVSAFCRSGTRRCPEVFRERLG